MELGLNPDRIVLYKEECCCRLRIGDRGSAAWDVVSWGSHRKMCVEGKGDSDQTSLRTKTFSLLGTYPKWQMAEVPRLWQANHTGSTAVTPVLCLRLPRSKPDKTLKYLIAVACMYFRSEWKSFSRGRWLQGERTNPHVVLKKRTTPNQQTQRGGVLNMWKKLWVNKNELISWSGSFVAPWQAAQLSTAGSLALV